MVNGEQVGDPVRLTDNMRRFDIDVGTTGRKIEIIVDEVFEGVVYSDMAIAEIAVNFPDTSQGKRMEQWIASKDGSRRGEIH